MSNETVSRRYSTALADVVIKKGETEPVRAELKKWEEMIFSNGDLLESFRNPTIAHTGKVRVLENLIKRTNPSVTTANFLRILLKNGRLTEIGQINARFASILDDRRGLISGQITSARELTDVEKTELLDNLLKLTRKQVILEFDIDKNIIGGVIARIGSTVYDGSVRTQLEELKDKLVNG